MKPGESIWVSLWNLFTNLPFLAGCAAYGFATLLWFYLLARNEFSFLYPFSSLTFVVSFIGAQFILGENISLQRWMAVGLICTGVVLVARS
jgi:drug/metabolite transporter (DMT)-like permease